MKNEINKMTLEDLFRKVDAAFNESDIKKYAEKNNFQWNYSITSTPIHKNGLLLVGFNYGAGKDFRYEKLIEIPEKNFIDQDLGSFRRVIPYLEKNYSKDQIQNIVQTNYCFFRSKTESEISANDKQLCQPLFINLLEIINPIKIICFSALLREYLESQEGIYKGIAKTEILSNKGIITATVGEIEINSKKIRIGFLPHPNYPLKKEYREQAWAFVKEKFSLELN